MSGTYSVIRSSRKDKTEQAVAKGLAWEAARRLCIELDEEYRKRIEAAGKHYSAWMADLHYCQLEPQSASTINSQPSTSV